MELENFRRDPGVRLKSAKSFFIKLAVSQPAVRHHAATYDSVRGVKKTAREKNISKWHFWGSCAFEMCSRKMKAAKKNLEFFQNNVALKIKVKLLA